MWHDAMREQMETSASQSQELKGLLDKAYHENIQLKDALTSRHEAAAIANEEASCLEMTVIPLRSTVTRL